MGLQTILFCTSQYYPSQTIPALINYDFTITLAKEGHKVYVITDATFQKAGPSHAVYSGGVEKQAIEIESNLFVIPFAIVANALIYTGETQAYQDFALNFPCDLLINVGLLNWSTDLLLPHLATCKATKKALRIHEEHAFMTACFSRKRLLKEVIKVGLSMLGLKKRGSLPYLDRLKLKERLKAYSCVFLSPNSRAYHYLKPLCTRTADLIETIQAPFLESVSLPENLAEPFMVNVADFSPESRQDFVLKSYYLSHVSLPLVLAGSVNTHQTLGHLQRLRHDLERAHGQKPVHFFYTPNRQEMYKLLSKAKLLLNASNLEISIVLLMQSVQLCIPFIATMDSAKDFHDDFFVQTPQEMAQKIDMFLTDESYCSQITQELSLKGLHHTDNVKGFLHQLA
ncbi:hypothetical protein [Helicobacter cynogastricus]|uniref:hypothetical protein n=1 Tax=Helicobacter cynogastricus TaxID=329937 RepID=UPI000CF13D65|nr:hypothetical protein [Helicobacter cynogastricus]